ncbi:acyl carrier protein [Parageobacillus thermoglucosidasius]|uniref:Carrier domain-containing protein n=1 Tax=Parageobacillus thermoglucosidasius TaxID=1426 RepID=A0AAN0YRA6_PARTM|nr:acyl carrier protein [Parageobacillus thermoglucosidasius]AEH49458.1 phosphopantetheine-binding protein [Parageobacillus thermoglucosidasius C56-YS93]ALF09395.1 hypothetical protein AOT13_04850 [Parageobacillus thermoglucosidasius]ANZ29478.1 hypothetical protein BCV53_04860 [Parageobacillus thermoglucosidasius]APM80216.1 hypothetical protein BCV54_04865 [Parageobacillus thermoglucosidasius]MED4906353.1 acyl carrier protein [Parageobacillus thermoglucosidasius]
MENTSIPRNVEAKEAVFEILAETLKLDVTEINESLRLSHDLGMDSIDVLDMLYDIEKKTGSVIGLQDFENYFRGELSVEEFRNANGVITEKGIRYIKEKFPNAIIPESGLLTRHLFELLTVGDLIKLTEIHR